KARICELSAPYGAIAPDMALLNLRKNDVRQSLAAPSREDGAVVLSCPARLDAPRGDEYRCPASEILGDSARLPESGLRPYEGCSILGGQAIFTRRETSLGLLAAGIASLAW